MRQGTRRYFAAFFMRYARRGAACQWHAFSADRSGAKTRRACTSGHPTGNGHRVATPRDERGIAMIGWGKKSSPIRLRAGWRREER